MFRVGGIDLGTTDRREVSVGWPWGAARPEDGVSRRTACVPSDVLTFRKIILPPSNRDVCRQVVQEELSYSLPFPIEEATWDFYGQRNQEAWVVVAPVDQVESVQREAGDGATLDAEPMAYLRACLSAGVHHALVIDLGASRTTFCAVVAGRVDWVRVMLRGGIHLSNLVATTRGVSPDQADSMKCSRGTELSECSQWLDELLEEAFLPDSAFTQVLVCGGGAAMPGLKLRLKQRFGVEPELFPLPDELSPYEHVVAYGAALASRPGQPRFRLIPQVQMREAQSSSLRAMAVWTLILMALIAADLEVRHTSLSRRYEQNRRNLSGVVKPALGEAADTMTADQMKQALEKRITSSKKARSTSVQWLMNNLAGLSEPLKGQPQTQLRQVTIDDGRVKLEGETASLKQAEQLYQELEKGYPDLKKIKIRPGAPDRFVFDFEGLVPQP